MWNFIYGTYRPAFLRALEIAIVVLVIAVLFFNLGGCAQVPHHNGTATNDYVADLAECQRIAGDAPAQNAVTGAVVGALVGALLGKAAGLSGKYVAHVAASGAASYAVTGAAIGAAHIDQRVTYCMQQRGYVATQAPAGGGVM